MCEGCEGITVSEYQGIRYHSPLYQPQHTNRLTNTTTYPLHTHPFQHPPSPLPASTNEVGDIEVGLGCDEHFNAFGATVACCGEHRSPAKLWAHNTTHRRESVLHCMAPKGTRHGCTDKGQCRYGWTLHVVTHCVLYIVSGYEDKRV